MEMKRVRPRWSGHETLDTMDSGIGYTQDLYGPAHAQLVGRKRRVDDDSLLIPGAEAPDSEGRIPWDAPHKRILFGSEGPDSTSSGSGIQKARPGWPPDNVYPDSTQYGQLAENRDREEVRLPGLTLEQKVLKLQKDLEEAKAESRYLRANRSATPVGTPNRPRVTSTPVPRYAGGSNWDQYREVFEAIVCSNGWDEVTASLQLVAHLDGEALNVALLVPESQRVLPGVLLKTLSAHYASPGRLAKNKRQFERMTRPPGDDPAAFAIELETLARKAFVDVDASLRLQLVRDRFIIGQENCALRHHLASMGPDTPIAEIVDRCHVWESHEEINSGWVVNPELNRPHAVFQVTDSNNNEQNETSTGLDVVENLMKRLLPSPVETTQETAPVPSDYELLAQRLCEMAQPPVPENSDTIDIEQLLRKLIPVGSVEEKVVRPAPEVQEVDDPASGNVA